jgi:hypothetical protein
MILRHADWNPNVIPCMDLTEDDISNLADEIVRFHEQFHSCFYRKEQQRLGLACFSGLFSNSKAKSVEPIALELLEGQSVRSLQRFMKTYRGDQQTMKNRIWKSSKSSATWWTSGSAGWTAVSPGFPDRQVVYRHRFRLSDPRRQPFLRPPGSETHLHRFQRRRPHFRLPGHRPGTLRRG